MTASALLLRVAGKRGCHLLIKIISNYFTRLTIYQRLIMANVAFVYVMQAGDYIKIGVTTTSIIKRAKQVQTGCPIPIEEIFFFSMETSSEAYLCEKILHKELLEHRSHGEWFHCFKQYTSKIEKIIGKKSDKFIFNDFHFFNKDKSIEFRMKIKDADNEDTLISISFDVHKSDDKDFKRYKKEYISNLLNKKLKDIVENNLRENNFDSVSISEHFNHYAKNKSKKRIDRLSRLSSNPLLKNIASSLLEKENI